MVFPVLSVILKNSVKFFHVFVIDASEWADGHAYVPNKSESVITEYFDFSAVLQSWALNSVLDFSGLCAQLQKASL